MMFSFVCERVSLTAKQVGGVTSFIKNFRDILRDQMFVKDDNQSRRTRLCDVV